MRLFAGSRDWRSVKWGVAALLAVFVLLAFVAAWQPALAQDAATPAQPTAEAPKEAPNFLSHIIKSAGPVFGPLILLMSVGLVALIVLLAMDLRLIIAIPPEFVQEFTDTVNKRKFKEAFELAKNDNSFLARVLTAGMGRLQYGLEDAREVVVNTVEGIKASKDQLITYLATIGTLGPLVGLVGTVFGMILAFMELTRGSQIRAEVLADKISHALVITMLGVGLSVPAIFCHAFFRNRLTRIANDTSSIADDLLTQMYYNSRKTVPAASVNSVPSQAAAKPVQA